MIRLRARPSFAPLPLLAAVLVMAVSIPAGIWQSGRAAEKDVIEARQAETWAQPEVQVGSDPVDPARLDGVRVVVRGEFLPASTVYWDNRFAGSVAGMAVVTPLRISGGQRVVLVDRGILVPGADRTRPPPVLTPPGEVEVHGRAYLAPRQALELADNADMGVVWQHVTPEKFASRSGLAVHGFLLRQAGTGRSAENLLRGPDRPMSPGGVPAAKHRAYAFQWYSFAALAFLLAVFFTLFEHVKQPGSA